MINFLQALTIKQKYTLVTHCLTYIKGDIFVERLHEHDFSALKYLLKEDVT